MKTVMVRPDNLKEVIDSLAELLNFFATEMPYHLSFKNLNQEEMLGKIARLEGALNNFFIGIEAHTNDELFGAANSLMHEIYKLEKIVL